MGVHQIAATEIPQDRSAIDTGGFTATVGEFDAPEGQGLGTITATITSSPTSFRATLRSNRALMETS
jgi:hypothetical protein